MRGTAFRWSVFGLATWVALCLSGCGYNALQGKDEQVKSAWSEVLNQYQRRADLIPNLVNTVKGYAAQEQTVLLGVTEARARAGSIQATPDMINDPQALAKFQAAQSELSGALSRLLVVRNRYIQAVQDYNLAVRQFPNNLTAAMFGYKVKPNFAVENEAVISKPPAVDFSAPPAATQPTPTPAPPPASAAPQ